MARLALKFETLEARDVPATSLSPLDDRMVDQMDTSTGRIGFSVVTPDRAAEDHNQYQVFGTSSTIKLGILYALMRRVATPLPAEGDLRILRLNFPINIGTQYGENQGGTLLSEDNYTLRALAETMIDHSNNWATNRLIDWLGVANINRAFADLGLTSTRIDRYMTGPGSVSMHGLGSVSGDYRAGHDNESTPAEMTSLLRQIHDNNGLLHPDSYAAFWEIMGLNATGSVSATYNDNVFTRPGVSWGDAMDLYLKPGSNTWTGNPATSPTTPSSARMCSGPRRAASSTATAA